MTYIDRARAALDHLIPGEDPALLDLYTLLVLARGEAVTLRDVHDAWALWRSRSRADHPALVPFDQLAPEVQSLDQPYADAIATVAQQLAAT